MADETNYNIFGKGKKKKKNEATVEKENEKENVVNSTPPTKKPACIKNYYQNYYLLFGNKQDEETLQENKQQASDPYQSTLEFLTNTLKYDGGELRQARINKEKYKDAIYSKTSNYCSYCFVPLSGAEYDVLADGRRRCPACSRSLIQSQADIEQLYGTTIENFRIYFDANIEVPVDVVVLNEKKFKRKLRKTIDGSVPEDAVILGCAVRKRENGANKYYLFLENGAPKISVIATIAHELTHIWQYEQEKRGLWKASNYSDIVKDENGRSLSKLEIYEGMAMWTEIQYMYIIGEEMFAERQAKRTESRADEYGVGFRAFANEFKLITDISAIPYHPFDIESVKSSKK